MNDQRDEHDSVRHLIDLGYIDPAEVSLREASLRRQLEAELQQAITTSKQGRVADAVVLLDRLKVDDPNWIAPHQLLAELHFRSGRLVEAQAELSWLEQHGVENPHLSLLAAGLAIMRRDFAVAVELLEYVVHSDPTLPSVHSTYGSVLLRLGKVERAHESFERALTRNEEDINAIDGMSAVCLAQGDYESAADWALSAVEKNMQFSRAHYHLGVALSKLNRSLEALAAFEASSRTDPLCLAPYYRMSLVADHHLHDRERAERYRTQGSQLLRKRRERRASGII